MASGRPRIRITGDTLTPALTGLNLKTHNRITAAVRRQALLAQNYARRNAPWTDRTGNARNGLFTISASDQKKHRIVLFHSVPYGIWLEVRWSGRYQIIIPTITHQGNELMNRLEDIFG